MATKRLSDTLRPASFRGVSFQVDASDMGAGRRVQVHEYPQRDKPWVEDLGRSARDISFAAFVVGEDYVDQANALLEALEKEGSGTLVHPWFGTLTVSLKEAARVAFDAGLGKATFTLSFVESGDLEYPAAGTSTSAVSRISADNLETASIASFADKFSVKGFQDFVTAAASGNLGDMLGVISSSEVGKVLGYANSLAATFTTVIGLITEPSSLAASVMGAFGLSGVATTYAAWSSIVRSLSRVSGHEDLDEPEPSPIYTPSRIQATQNASAVNSLGRQAMLVQAIGASSLVGTLLDNPAAGMTPGAVSIDYRQPTISAGEIIAVRDELLTAIDRECLLANDAVYQALLDARNAVYSDLTARAMDNARLVTLTPPEVMPMLAIAYDYYEDATRDAEIVARNAVRHPGFVPALPLKVLTR